MRGGGAALLDELDDEDGDEDELPYTYAALLL